MKKLTLNKETLLQLEAAGIEQVNGGQKKISQVYRQCGTGAQSIVIPCHTQNYQQCGTGAASIVVAC